MNAPDRKMLELSMPGLEKNEPAAVFAWFSTRRLVVIKESGMISLSADDVRALRRFVEHCEVEAPL